ncbi:MULTISPECIES: 3'(2'),5'-bisphosphate nucleotidase CysQ [unclassified Sphingomonas]|uniref:3'(2'),5'-bisphosphate nucleotidase CysQ n=1 Tax=unclassified Sphingomonas TaxID=196159 RepID=UPI002151B93C|nr:MULTISPECIES: 3'(2'),5'-bisphosphate nucleotidase CysQ [unclassified Sphingomonas]MCR5871137.1 3'(2'),5'-bisphosphate nucleotidase CysQ [Sphingomonas sp. J344]UUY00548.1 3'(2'),5'-bisphosphate nucleotidase CysQ [Sphingomonas sp. J315]
MDDASLARSVADAAAALLLKIQDDGADGARGDRDANRLIHDMLLSKRPDDPILSEESADDPLRLGAPRVWIVDPLDGTREFAEGRDDWAVHIGLAIDGVAAVGAVALPRRGVTLATDAPPALRPASGVPRMLVSRTRPSRLCGAVADMLGASLIPMGSAGAKAMAVVMGEAEIYLHSGGQYQWDNCAPAAVALAAGLHVSRIDGTPIVYNRPARELPDLLICRKQLADGVLATIKAFQHGLRRSRGSRRT